MRSLQITGSSRGWGGVFRSLIAVEGGDESEDDWLQRGGGAVSRSLAEAY